MSRLCVRALLALLLGCAAAAGPVPSFTLAGLDGVPFRLADHVKSQVIVLDFWATWCGPCTRSLKHLQELQARYPDVLVLAIATDDGRTQAQVAPYVRGRGFTFKVLLDPEGSVCRMMDPGGGIPFTAVLDRQGALVYRHSGYLPGDELGLFAAVAKLRP